MRGSKWNPFRGRDIESGRLHELQSQINQKSDEIQLELDDVREAPNDAQTDELFKEMSGLQQITPAERHL